MLSKVTIVVGILALTLHVLATDSTRDCSNSCQPTCQRPRGSENCNAGNTDCKCKPGDFLSSNLGYCVPANECEKHCLPNQIYRGCRPCPRPFLCRLIACVPGCYCNDGYELHPTEDKCVLKDTPKK